MKRRFWIWIPVAMIAMAACACGKKDEAGGDQATNQPQPPASTTGTPPATNPTTTEPAAGSGFAKVQPIFAENCVKCHGGASPKGGIDLSSYASVMKGGSEGPVVVAGNPDQSKIVMALKGAPGVKKMPMMAAPLADDKIAMISDWIKDGAKEN